MFVGACDQRERESGRERGTESVSGFKWFGGFQTSAGVGGAGMHRADAISLAPAPAAAAPAAAASTAAAAGTRAADALEYEYESYSDASSLPSAR